MNREEKISLYGYIEDLYQAMQIGSITFEPKHSSELYELISKVLKENQELKQDIKNLVNVINNNCVELSTTNAEYESLKRWNK